MAADDEDLKRQGIPQVMPGAAVNLEWSSSFVLFPADTNHIGIGFGGKLLAEMDRIAGITTRRLLYDSVRTNLAVTAGITDVEFENFCKVGDLLIVTGKVVKLGRTSITVYVTVERETGHVGSAQRTIVAKGTFTFVSWDGVSKSIAHGLALKGE